jgi:hypothetical protein
MRWPCSWLREAWSFIEWVANDGRGLDVEEDRDPLRAEIEGQRKVGW